MTTVERSFDASAYSADAIQRAAYRFCDRFSLELRRQGDQFACSLTFPGEPDACVLSDFQTEALDQVLRERIRKDTEGVRNVILALAFSNAAVERDA